MADDLNEPTTRDAGADQRDANELDTTDVDETGAGGFAGRIAWEGDTPVYVLRDDGETRHVAAFANHYVTQAGLTEDGPYAVEDGEPDGRDDTVPGDDSV